MEKIKNGCYSILICYKRLILFAFISLLILFSSSTIFSQTGSTVVINEIVYDPDQIDTCDDSNGEWVEIKNTDSSTPLTMTNWSVKDATTTLRSFSGEVSANGYAILVSNKSCFLQNHPGVSEFLIIDLNTKIGSGLNNSNGTSGFADQIFIFDEAGTQVAMVEYSDEAVEGKSLALFGGSWEEANPTPGAENVFDPGEPGPSPQPGPESAVTFSAPSSVVGGQEFIVTVSFSNFEPGTYALKVLIGKGDNFIYGNTKGSSDWLTQNGKWAEMPSVSIVHSGSVSKSIRAKVDDDASSGNYAITVSVAEKNGDDYEPLWSTGELETIALKVTAAPVGSHASQVVQTGNADGAENQESPALTQNPESFVQGEVLGEESAQKEEFQLNFYVIVGIFGLIVGSGGLVLGFRYRRNNSVAAR
ncbi:MAG TPA: lamin tail domain-containing protein [Patescibacteria group bacterium]|nr:lamin tail domain-containing protein [Patescibacteria group bacterium]